MAWRHKTLRSTNILVGNCIFNASDDGTISPSPEGEAVAAMRFLPEFERLAEEKPAKAPAKKAKAEPVSSSPEPEGKKEKAKPSSASPKQSKTKKKKKE